MRRGITLVETVISVVVVGVMLSAAISAAGMASTQGVIIVQREQAMLLAGQIMSEIQGKAYEDPDGGVVMGLEADELLAVTRAVFDDVDDYDGWEDSPPVDAGGVALAGGTGFRRSVEVREAGASIAGATAASSVKQVRVRVFFGSRLAAELVAYRTAEGAPAIDGSGS